MVTLAASSAASLLVEELQFVLGEGPCMDAHASRTPVLVPDLKAAKTTMWPGYATAVEDHGIRAVFAFPLQIGAARLGVMDVYRDHPGNLSEDTLSGALVFADIAMEALLDAGQESASAADLIDSADDATFEVYQAQGMVMVDLGVTLDEALARLRAHAYAANRPLAEVASDIVEGNLRLSRDKP